METRRKLTEKQEAFARHFAANGDPLRAYITSGYRTRIPSHGYGGAHKLLKNPHVRRRIEELEAADPKHELRQLLKLRNTMLGLTQDESVPPRERLRASRESRALTRQIERLRGDNGRQ